MEWTLSESPRASPRRRSTAVIQRDQLIHRGLRNPFVRWRGDTRLQQTDTTAEVTVCSSEWLYEGRNKQAARTRWQRPAGGFTGMFSALERKASREPRGWKKTPEMWLFFLYCTMRRLAAAGGEDAPLGSTGIFVKSLNNAFALQRRSDRRTSLKWKLREPLNGTYCTYGPDSDDDNTHLVRKLHTPLSLS